MGGPLTLQVNAAHGLVEMSAPTLGQARRTHAARTRALRPRCARSAPALRPLCAPPLCAPPRHPSPSPSPSISHPPLRAQAFAWQAAIARSARAFHEEHGTQHALAMLLPLQASDAAPSPAAAQLVASLGPLIDVLAERVALPPEGQREISSSLV